ncbi:hypothetical protein OIU76_024628 [Salix suchowensis]|nr:hypothetical protein OIU76_024628 [Salix suchowensis]
MLCFSRNYIASSFGFIHAGRYLIVDYMDVHRSLSFLAEKQSPWSYPDDNITCGPHCYKSVLKSERISSGISPEHGVIEENFVCQSDGAGVPITSRKKSSAPYANRRVKSCHSESASSNAKSISESRDSEIRPWQDASFTS